MGHEQIYSLLVEKDEISWKSIIMDLIRKEEVNPWDIDVSLLSQKYMERIKQLKEAELSVGGKVLLAAALLLRIKSTRLVGDDLDEFDRLIAGPVADDDFYDDLERELAAGERRAEEEFHLHPRVPQSRRRKVSVYDLVKALEKALEVKHRRVLHSAPPEIPLPRRVFDVTQAINGLMSRIKAFMSKQRGPLTFKKLVSSRDKQEVVYTFIPLLHLSNSSTLELKQDEAFGDISITLLEGKHE